MHYFGENDDRYTNDYFAVISLYTRNRNVQNEIF